ncbi:hypothetical protein BV22DRAFT_336222 [Leucogyrophana mollusca]|uniref:Uncharacterized protein n=1 Tax=Leucogyrophana mollusca TaxID=85980 RepID=A0ACB8BLH5_9AGAM|nr:hypothetical protein BV22DRAFT_336222 [Leucogyrophana mollusca]
MRLDSFTTTVWCRQLYFVPSRVSSNCGACFRRPPSLCSLPQAAPELPPVRTPRTGPSISTPTRTQTTARDRAHITNSPTISLVHVVLAITSRKICKDTFIQWLSMSPPATRRKSTCIRTSIVTKPRTLTNIICTAVKPTPRTSRNRLRTRSRCRFVRGWTSECGWYACGKFGVVSDRAL